MCSVCWNITGLLKALDLPSCNFPFCYALCNVMTSGLHQAGLISAVLWGARQMKPQLLDELSLCLPIAAACSSRTKEFWAIKTWLCVPLISEIAKFCVFGPGGAVGMTWVGFLAIICFISESEELFSLWAVVTADPVYDSGILEWFETLQVNLEMHLNKYWRPLWLLGVVKGLYLPPSGWNVVPPSKVIPTKVSCKLWRSVSDSLFLSWGARKAKPSKLGKGNAKLQIFGFFLHTLQRWKKLRQV